MGLDMFLFGKKEIKNRVEEEKVEVGYWRKHADLHRYIENLYIEKGGKEEFNCVDYLLSKEEIEDIIQKSKDRTLDKSEGGFFFGESIDEDNENTIKIMTKALKYMKKGYKIYYTSWW